MPPPSAKPEIPSTPLHVPYVAGGMISPVALHGRNGLYYHESSYGFFGLAGAMLAIGIVIALLPWEEPALGGKLKYWIAGGCAWGALCVTIPYFVRNEFGQHIIIDPAAKTVRIFKDYREQTIAWDQILGLQICYEVAPGDSECSGFQLNLAWANAEGNVERHCLLKHEAKSYVIELGESYRELFAFPVVDHAADRR